MAEKVTTEQAAPDATAAETQPEGAERTFTQAELEHAISERLKRERAKFQDYDTLKAAAAQLEALKAEQLSELEKAQKRATEAEVARDRALAEANGRLIRAAFVAEAAKAGAAHPEDAFALADLANVAIGDNGAVAGVAEAVKALVDGGRLVMQARAGAPGLDGGAGAGERPKSKPLTAEQLAVARKLGIKAEDYAARLNS